MFNWLLLANLDPAIQPDSGASRSPPKAPQSATSQAARELTSGFRWSFYGVADVNVGISVAAILVFLALCLFAV